MLYRVFLFALVAASSAHGAAISPQTGSGADAILREPVPLAELLYGFRYAAAETPHPMNAAGDNLMWDASGQGCIDGGAWEDPLPGMKGDVRAPVFCIPQPCLGLLSEDELAREVYGRPLDEGEYATYLARLEETCGGLPDPAVDHAGADLDEYLRFASLQLVAYDGLPTLPPLAPFVPATVPGGDKEMAGGALCPSNLLVPLTRTYLGTPSHHDTCGGRDDRRGGPAASTGFAGGGSGGGGGGTSKPPVSQPPWLPPGDTPGGGTPGGHTPGNGGTPGGPGNGGTPGDGGTPQPSPVPVGGSMPLLLTAFGALLVRFGPVQRRRSRRELMG